MISKGSCLFDESLVDITPNCLHAGVPANQGWQSLL